MSLDFSYENCGKTKEERELLMTHPADSTQWHPVGNALVWLSLSCGYNKITEDNLDSVWRRVDASQRLFGPQFGYDTGLVWLTKADVEKYIGLSTNVSAKTDAQFAKGLMDPRTEFKPRNDPPAMKVVADKAKQYLAKKPTKKE